MSKLYDQKNLCFMLDIYRFIIQLYRQHFWAKYIIVYTCK